MTYKVVRVKDTSVPSFTPTNHQEKKDVKNGPNQRLSLHNQRQSHGSSMQEITNNADDDSMNPFA